MELLGTIIVGIIAIVFGAYCGTRFWDWLQGN